MIQIIIAQFARTVFLVILITTTSWTATLAQNKANAEALSFQFYINDKQITKKEGLTLPFPEIMKVEVKVLQNGEIDTALHIRDFRFTLARGLTALYSFHKGKRESPYIKPEKLFMAQQGDKIVIDLKKIRYVDGEEKWRKRSIPKGQRQHIFEIAN